MTAVASIVRPAAPAARVEATRLPTWPVVALFAWFPLWWLLGLGGFVPVLLAVPMAAGLLVDRSVRFPRVISLWGLFLTWVALSATQVPDADSLLVLGYRFALYVSAGITFVYIYNVCRRADAGQLLVRSMAALWVTVVVGGSIALLSPGLQMTSLTEILLPGSVLENRWVADMVHVHVAEGRSLRPVAPFTYTNEWGANFALLLPIALVAVFLRRRPTLRWPLLVMGSVGPLLLSTNRGAWLSIAVGFLYSLTLLRGQARVMGFVGTVLGILLIAALVSTTGLADRINESFTARESTTTRASIYDQTIDAIERSPWIGYGGPRPSRFSSQPPLGTHGQLWMTMYSHGVPGTAFYIAFLLAVLFRTRKARGPVGIAANMVLAITIVQLPFYGALPMQLFVTMAAGGLALAETHRQEPVG